MLDTTDGSASVVATNMAYPLGDVILLSLVVGGFAVTRWHPGRAWAFLGASLIDQRARRQRLPLRDGDRDVQRGRHPRCGLADRAAPDRDRRLAGRRTRPDRSTCAAGNLLAAPTLCALVAITLLIVDHFHRLNLVAITLATLTLAGVLTRLAFTFRENGNLLRRTTDEAITDALTGLGNRRRLISDLDATMEVATIEEPWLLAIFDLDGFKGVQRRVRPPRR